MTTSPIKTPFQPLSASEQDFQRTLSALGGFAHLKKTLKIQSCWICRGLKGELILCFPDCSKASKVQIELVGADRYTLTFYRFSLKLADRGCNEVAVLESDRATLSKTFDSFTGLRIDRVQAPAETRFSLPGMNLKKSLTLPIGVQLAAAIGRSLS